jgi:hypothetical protein
MTKSDPTAAPAKPKRKPAPPRTVLKSGDVFSIVLRQTAMTDSMTITAGPNHAAEARLIAEAAAAKGGAVFVMGPTGSYALVATSGFAVTPLGGQPDLDIEENF